jgi:Domain of unknown function (DUF1931)
VSMMGVVRFERFFRKAAGLDVDKSDLKRYGEFVDKKLYDLLLRGEAAAKANGRDVIQPFDLPITKGLQESIHAFRKMDAASDPRSAGRSPAARPCLWRGDGMSFRVTWRSKLSVLAAIGVPVKRRW